VIGKQEKALHLKLEFISLFGLGAWLNFYLRWLVVPMPGIR